MKLELIDQRSRPEPLPVPPERLRALIAPTGRDHWLLDLVLVEDPVMADLYGRWYGGEGVTDVLSFTYLETDGAGAPQLPAGTGEAACDLWVPPADATGPVLAGEVILAPGFVAERCGREGWDLPAEWALLLVHGTLHVLGWRHDTPDRRTAMRAREAALLAAQGLPHPLGDDEVERS